jgi:DNA-binding CsgD family transcriptional regulator/sugar-specific transcriptional regulator TrmB
MTEDSASSAPGGVPQATVVAGYAALMSEPGMSADRLAIHLDADLPTAEMVLGELTAASLANRAGGTGSGTVPQSPLFALQSAIAQERAALDARYAQLKSSMDVISAAMPEYATRVRASQEDGTERVYGVHEVRQRLAELAVQAQHEVMAFSPMALVPIQARTASQPLDAAHLQRGLRMRVIYPGRVAYDSEALRQAHQLADGGARIRTADDLPMRMIVVDGDVAVLPIDPPHGATGALVIHDSSTVTALSALFEAYWKDGRELGPRDDPTGCGPAERAVLQLLASGAKDDAVARHLGVSVRTVRRIIADLMVLVDANSRFELGVNAARRGWI